MAEENKKSVLVGTKKEEEIPKIKYSDDEEEYRSNWIRRMEASRDLRDTPHDEFDGMDYITQYESNERLANTFVQPKRNKEDSNFQSGIIRQKLFALLSAINNLDLRGDISAFNTDGFEVQALGDAMEDIILKTNELDVDDEKKMLRFFELLKQGTVFVEELWSEKYYKSKKTNKRFSGQLKDFDFTTNLKKAFARPTRNIVPGVNVYLGSMSIYDNQEQPYIFTVDTKPYFEAKSIFGKWERWQYVPKKLVRTVSDDRSSLINKDWTLLTNPEGNVEIIRAQDKCNNEFALFLNGILMTPIGLPMTDIWGYEDYNITQQNLEPIHAKFTYGKSLVSRTRNKANLLDEMLKLAVLKTQKSFMPPYLNISGRVVSNRVFMPGKITHGIAPGTLTPINDKESQGVTNSEFAMIKEIQSSIDSETVSPVFQGQSAPGNPTATEVLETQRQAKVMLGLTVFGMSMLEWKSEWLRLKNILAHWFEKEDEVVDKVREVLKSKYRKITTDYMVENEGMGKRLVIPTEQIPSGEAIMQAEDVLSKEQGMPIRMIFVNPQEITSAKMIWQIVIKPKERKTSEVSKLLFREFMADVTPLGPNIEYLREKAASVWEENPSKLFAQDPEQMQQQAMAAQAPESGTSARVNMPTANKMVGQEMNSMMKTQ